MGAGAPGTQGRAGPLLWILLLSSLPSPEAAPTVQPLGPSPWQALADGGETPRVQEVARDSKDQTGPKDRLKKGDKEGEGLRAGPVLDITQVVHVPSPPRAGHLRDSLQQGGPQVFIPTKPATWPSVPPMALQTRGQVCGKPKAVGKVYGGQDAEAGQWPWQASLLYHGSHLCGAVLIDSHWLVSTAHCFRNKSQALMDYQVLLGNTELYQQTQHTQKISVSKIIIHPDFEKFHPFGSDIAMLQLHLPVNVSPYVIPVCLPAPDMQLPSHTSCWITGWGMLTEDMRLLPPFSLQEAEVGLITNELCNLLFAQRTGRDHLVQEEMLCVGNFSTGNSICEGDSGGPLVCLQPGAWVLVGLASWGLDCRHPTFPGVFTRVTYFTDWISTVKRLTPVLDSLPGSPPGGFLPPPLRATGSRKTHSVPRPAQTCLLLSFMLQAPQQAGG